MTGNIPRQRSEESVSHLVIPNLFQNLKKGDKGYVFQQKKRRKEKRKGNI